MQFECTDDVHFPAEDVYKLIRDDMTSLVPYLNDVDEIVVLERKDEADAIKITNLWRGSMSRAPGVVQKFLSKDLVSWNDHAVWPRNERCANWRLEPKVGSRIFECAGKTSVLDGTGPGTCRIRVAGDLNVYPDRLPGVPRLLAGTLRSKIESFVIDMLVPNLRNLARGVQAYVDDKAKNPPK